MEDDIARVLISKEALETRVAGLADEIAAAYAECEGGITIVTILAGSLIFLADLMRRLPMKMKIGLVSVSSYAGATTTSRGAVLASTTLPEIAGRHVLIVDDILDTGGTLRLVQDELRKAGPRSVRTTVLLRKPNKAPADVKADFVGFDIEDAFVVGYGLDYDGLYRNLPYVAVLTPDAYDRGESR